MDCFPDFCIGCDSQAVDGFYCSETCRMADIERSSPSVPSSPTGNFASHHSAFHFAQPKQSSRQPAKKPGRANRTHSSNEVPRSQQRALTPSSSRSSLSSNGNDVVPQEAVKELQNYFNAFDRTREQRRQSMLVAQQSPNWDSAEPQ